MRDTNSLKILQYNVQKSYSVMAALLRDPAVLQYDVIAIQEPWLNPRDRAATHNPTQGNFRTWLAPQQETEDRPMLCFLIRDTVITEHTRVTSTGTGRFINTLHIVTQIDDTDTPVAIHNLYNPHSTSQVPHIQNGRFAGIPENSILPELDLLLNDDSTYHVVVGDFNLHHPAWSGDRSLPSNNRKSAEPPILLAMAVERGIELCTVPGTVTRHRTGERSTVLDLTWASDYLVERMTRCGVHDRFQYGSDHLPVATEFDLAVPK